MNQGPTGLDRNPWLEHLFRPLVIGVMVGCVALSLVELVRLIFPAWDGTYLVMGCVLAAVEATYSYRLVRTRRLRGGDLLRFRAIELTLFFLLLKIGNYLGQPWLEVLADVRSWPYQVERLFDLETIAAFILALFAWYAATQTVGEFERLNEPPEFSRYYISPLDRLTGRFFRGGVVLLIAAGLTRIGIAALLNLRRPSVPGLVLNVLVYFLLGLVMLGQVRYDTLRKRWQTQEVKVADELPGRWVRYSLAFIGLSALLAFLLPTGYTLGLLQMIGWALGAIFSVVYFLVMLLFWLIALPLAWLLSFLGSDFDPGRPSPPPPRAAPIEPGGHVGPGWFQVLRSLVFWVIALGMVFYLVRSYVRDHPELMQSLAHLGVIRALSRLWTALRRWLGGWGKAIGGRIPRRFSLWPGRRGQPAGRPFGFFRLGAQSPRAQVLYYYLSIVRRAGQRGLARRPAQTPDEYRAALAPSLPEAQQEVDLLTQAFVEARYSRHDVEAAQARRVRANWRQVKAALQALGRKKDEGTQNLSEAGHQGAPDP